MYYYKLLIKKALKNVKEHVELGIRRQKILFNMDDKFDINDRF